MIGDNHKGETLYGLGKCCDYKWVEMGDKDTQPKYQVQVKDGKPNGLGVLIFPSGGKYVGSWKNGLRNGKGTTTYQNGNKYVGEYKDGKKWNGKYYNKNGSIIYYKMNGKRK